MARIATRIASGLAAAGIAAIMSTAPARQWCCRPHQAVPVPPASTRRPITRRRSRRHGRRSAPAPLEPSPSLAPGPRPSAPANVTSSRRHLTHLWRGERQIDNPPKWQRRPRARNSLKAGDDQGRRPRCRPWGRALGFRRHRQGSPSLRPPMALMPSRIFGPRLRLPRGWPRAAHCVTHRSSPNKDTRPSRHRVRCFDPATCAHSLVLPGISADPKKSPGWAVPMMPGLSWVQYWFPVAVNPRAEP
jgi:hypothetical protein